MGLEGKLESHYEFRSSKTQKLDRVLASIWFVQIDPLRRDGTVLNPLSGFRAGVSAWALGLFHS
jgi:hypothetical protein